MSSNTIQFSPLRNVSQLALQEWVIRDPETALENMRSKGFSSFVSLPVIQLYKYVWKQWEQQIRDLAPACRRKVQEISADLTLANVPAIFKCWSVFSQNEIGAVCAPFEISQCNWCNTKEVFDLSEKLSLLKTVWPRMHNALIDAGVPANANIPNEQASTFTIRAWLQNSENAKHLNRVIILDLSNLGLLDIPEELKYFTNLLVLDLSENRLTELSPDIFRGLSQLRELFLRNNRLTALPSAIFQGLSQLRMLHLGNNQLIELPPDVFQDLVQLETLFLISNRLTALPPDVFGRLSQLKILNIANNQMAQLPPFDCFRGLSQLEALYFWENQLPVLAEHYAFAVRFNHRS